MALGKDGGSGIGLFKVKSEEWVTVVVQTEHIAEKAVEGVSLSNLISPTHAERCCRASRTKRSNWLLRHVEEDDVLHA